MQNQVIFTWENIQVLITVATYVLEKENIVVASLFFLCNSGVCPNKVSLNRPFSPRDAEIMQQKQKKADGDGKGGTKTK